MNAEFTVSWNGNAGAIRAVFNARIDLSKREGDGLGEQLGRLGSFLAADAEGSRDGRTAGNASGFLEHETGRFWVSVTYGDGRETLHGYSADLPVGAENLAEAPEPIAQAR